MPSKFDLFVWSPRRKSQLGSDTHPFRTAAFAKGYGVPAEAMEQTHHSHSRFNFFYECNAGLIKTFVRRNATAYAGLRMPQSS